MGTTGLHGWGAAITNASGTRRIAHTCGLSVARRVERADQTKARVGALVCMAGSMRMPLGRLLLRDGSTGQIRFDLSAAEIPCLLQVTCPSFFFRMVSHLRNATNAPLFPEWLWNEFGGCSGQKSRSAPTHHFQHRSC